MMRERSLTGNLPGQGMALAAHRKPGSGSLKKAKKGVGKKN
jgi:hypothetical protein